MNIYRIWERHDYQNKLLHGILLWGKVKDRIKTTCIGGIRGMTRETELAEEDWRERERERKKTGDRGLNIFQ